MEILGSILQVSAAISIIIGGLVYAFKSFRESSSNYDSKTIQSLKEAYDAMELENKNLRARLLELENGIKHLEQANQILKDTIVGKDILLQIKESISKFDFIIPKMEEFEKKDNQVLEALTAVLQKLNNMEREAKNIGK